MGVLAIDAGTTGVTALVVTPDGRIAARSHREVAQHSPEPGWAESSPEDIWQATLGSVREVLATVDPAGLTAIGVTSLREAVVLWDRETLGSPRRALAQPDRRSAEVCERLRSEGHEGRIAELTGSHPHPAAPGARLGWLAEHDPHTWALVEAGRYAVGGVDSYLVARMTRGTWHVTDVSHAGRTLLLDLEAGDWSGELCTLLGVPRDALPDLVPTWGEVAPSDARSFLGLSLPIAAIAGDRQSVLFGQTCFDQDEAACTYGFDTSVITTTGGSVVRGRSGLVPTAAWRVPDGDMTYALEGAVDGSGTDGIEDTALGVRDLVQALPELTTLRVDGRAAADDRLCQLQADQVGRVVERPEVVETAALGVALMAGLGTGTWASTEDLRGIRLLDRRFEPADPAG